MTKRKGDEAEAPAVALNVRLDIEALKTAIKLVMPVGSIRRMAHPALSCITLRGLGDAVEVSYRGIDSESRFRVAGTGTGDVLLPVRALTAFGLAARGEVTLTKAPADDAVQLADGHGFHFSAIPVAMKLGEMPSMIDRFTQASNAEPGHSFSLGDGVLVDLLAFCSPFISSEETRYYLNGVSLAFEEDGAKLRAVATDGHRMGARAIPLPAKWRGPLDTAVIVPRDLVTLVQRHAADREVKTTLYPSGVIFEIAGGLTIGGRLIDGTFPDWRRVVPAREAEGFVEVDIADAKRVLRAIGAANGLRGANAVRIRREGDAVTFTYTDRDAGTLHATIAGTASEKIESYVAGFEAKAAAQAPNDFGLNFKYLTGMLTLLGRTTKRARLLVKTAGHPVRFEPAGDEPGDDILILMPMRV